MLWKSLIENTLHKITISAQSLSYILSFLWSFHNFPDLLCRKFKLINPVLFLKLYWCCKVDIFFLQNYRDSTTHSRFNVASNVKGDFFYLLKYGTNTENVATNNEEEHPELIILTLNQYMLLTYLHLLTFFPLTHHWVS